MKVKDQKASIIAGLERARATVRSTEANVRGQERSQFASGRVSAELRSRGRPGQTPRSANALRHPAPCACARPHATD